MKIIFSVKDNDALVEIEQPDGTFKSWRDDLAPEDIACILSAGMLMQKGTMMTAAFSCSDKTSAKISRLEKTLDKAQDIFLSIVKEKQL